MPTSKRRSKYSGVTERVQVVRAHRPEKKPLKLKLCFLMKVTCTYIKNLKDNRHEAFLKNIGLRSNTWIEIAYVF